MFIGLNELIEHFAHKHMGAHWGSPLMEYLEDSWDNQLNGTSGAVAWLVAVMFAKHYVQAWLELLVGMEERGGEVVRQARRWLKAGTNMVT